MSWLSDMFGGGAAKEAEATAQQARADEAARVARIKAGTTRIGQIFEGGALTPTGLINPKAAKFDPKGKYYDKTGKAITFADTGPSTTTGTRQVPILGGDTSNVHGTGGGSRVRTETFQTPVPGKTAEQAFIDAVGGGGVYSGVNKSAGTFSPEYYKKLRDSYINFATPQLVDQYTDAQKQLVYAMARSGNLDSSARGQLTADATKIYNTGKQDIVDKGNEYVNTNKTAVEDARSGLITTLNATGDAQGAATSAINRARTLSAPPAYSPLTQLFSDFTAHLGTQAALERSEAASGYDLARYNTHLFTPGRTSVT